MTLPLGSVGQAAIESAAEFERAFSVDSVGSTGSVSGTNLRAYGDIGGEDAATQLHDAAETILAARLRQRVANRIAESREKELIPPKAPAIDLIRGVARELELAGHALEEAARALLNVTGQGGKAKAAHLAGQRAKDAADGLTGA